MGQEWDKHRGVISNEIGEESRAMSLNFSLSSTGRLWSLVHKEWMSKSKSKPKPV